MMTAGLEADLGAATVFAEYHKGWGGHSYNYADAAPVEVVNGDSITFGLEIPLARAQSWSY